MAECTTRSAPSSSGRWTSGVASVLSTASSASGLRRAAHDGGQVGDRQQRVGRRLQPQQVGLGGQLEPARRVLDGDANHAPPALRGTCRGQPGDALVAVVRQRRWWRRPAAGRRSPRRRPCPRRTRRPGRPRGRRAAPRTPPRSASRHRGCRPAREPSSKFDASTGGHVQRRPGGSARVDRPTRPTSRARALAFCTIEAI